MTVTACYQWVSASRTKDRCIGCIGPDCTCPTCKKGWHYYGDTERQAERVNTRFIDDRKHKDRLFAR